MFERKRIWKAIGIVTAVGAYALLAQYTPPSGGSLSACGSSGQVLTNSSGSCVGVATISGAQGGGLVLLEQHTASTSAELDFTSCISSTYDDYAIEIVNLIAATSATTLIWQASTNGGSTYDTGSNYQWSRLAWNETGGAVNAGSTADTSIVVGFAASNTSTNSLNSEARLYNPGSSATYKVFSATNQQIDSSGKPLSTVVGGAYKVTTAVNAFRFLAGSGNITSGTIRCYGLSK